ncbi:MAG: hypothetical protein K0Q49_2299 [Haloplasmataceae bacterium]|jgi:hypothetical protein|nr:hypothetical protein [Haloplasmataceae bacterium]
MEKVINLKDEIIYMSDEIMESNDFIENYNAVNKENNGHGIISAIFNYNSVSYEKFEELDLNSFKNFIADDFRNLQYQPDNVLTIGEYIIVEWIISDEFLFNELQPEDINIILSNMKIQLKTLKSCDLCNLAWVIDERDISKEMYFYNYYRKNQFEKILLKK